MPENFLGESDMSQDDYRQELAANGDLAGVEMEDDIHEFPFDADKITISAVPVPVSRLLDRFKRKTISSPVNGSFPQVKLLFAERRECGKALLWPEGLTTSMRRPPRNGRPSSGRLRYRTFGPATRQRPIMPTWRIFARYDH